MSLVRRSVLLVASALIAAGLVASSPVPAGADHTGSGYWMLTDNGVVHHFGDARNHGDFRDVRAQGLVDLEPTPSGHGYWLLGSDGNIYGRGDVAVQGRPPTTLAPGETFVSLSRTPSGQGYWAFTSHGRVFPFGDAVHRGDMAGTKLNAAVLDSVATPSGNGYWMVAADGGIFSFGDAEFYGSMGKTPLNKPVMSMAPDPDGVGYWLVASDGGIFAFDAPFYGSTGEMVLNKPVTGMVGGSAGYLMVAEDGGIFSFGDVEFHGSLGDNPPPSPVVAVALMPEPTVSLLAGLRVAPEGARAGYDRGLFNHWIGSERPGCDTRDEVLIDESVAPAQIGSGCVVTGEWFSVYDGVTTTDPSTFDVDHVVALAEAWDSGASGWDATRRQNFANDLGYAGSLIAVSASSNRSKSDRDPAEWLPPRREAWCSFATAWVNVKIRWGLSADDAEAAALRNALAGCDGSTPAPIVPPSTPPPSDPPPATVNLTVTALDCGDERVTVRNDGTSTADLTGWKIHDEGTLHTYSFPSGYTLGSGASVTVKSGGAAGPGELHWMNGFVWNNTGDTASLVNPGGTVVSTKSC